MSNYGKKGNGIQWAITLVTFSLVAVLLTGLCLQLFGSGKYKPSEWFKRDETTQEVPNTEANFGGAVIGDIDNSGVDLVMTALDTADYAAYGVTSAAESAYTLTATISPADADNKTVEWSVAWVNSSSAWASGKNVSAYITAVPSASNTNVVTVSCLQAFGEQVAVTASSVAESNISATATVDYVKRVNVQINTTVSALSFSSVCGYTVTPVYSVGTVQGDFTLTNIAFTLETGFSSAVYSAMTSGHQEHFTGRYPNGIVLDKTAQTLSFDGSTPYSVFGGHDGTKPYHMTMPSAYNTAFRTTAETYSGNHAAFTVWYTYTYNGVGYASNGGLAYKYLNFDVAALAVLPSAVSLNTATIVF